MTAGSTTKEDYMAKTARISTWVDADLLDRMKVRAAVESITLRSLVETALTEWVERNPIDMEEVERLTS